ncbi:hypothetical protein HY256_03240, partial [Candidatus Sumerlaeota bacterium]|nr:hypothetical protein [Candidatus Sumerlaeota bacterium]
MNEGLEIYYKTFKRGIGVLLALAVAVYMAVVTIEGGVMNWDRPKTETEIRSGFIKFAIR